MNRNNINYNKLAKSTKKKTKREKYIKFSALIMVLAIVSSVIISLLVSLSSF